MKIGIIGLGVVGRAIRSYHEINGDDIIGIDLMSSDWLLRECDGIYISVPSPSNEDGSCNIEILDDVLTRVYEIVGDLSIPLISKVTAPPEQYSQLGERYWQLVYCPEFLTAENANLDYLSTDHWIVGGGELRELAGRIISKLDNIVLTDIKTASLYKYMMNSYMAMKVTFMNEFHELAMHHGIKWDDIVRLSGYDRRIGASHMQVPGRDGVGWSGSCFPKDLAAISHELECIGILGIIAEVIRVNDLQRNSH